MLRLALSTLRFRKGGFVATFVAMFFGSAIVMACGGLMETGIRLAVPAQRLAAAEIVVTGDRSYEFPTSDPAGEEPETEGTTLAERVPLDAGLVEAVRAVPGVAKAVGDVSFAATPIRAGRALDTGGSAPQGHDWSSAELAPFVLREGAAPGRAGEIVLDSGLAERSGTKVGGRLEVAVRGITQTYVVTGIAAPTGDLVVDRPSVFFSSPDARRLSGHPDQVTAIGVTATPGTDLTELRVRLDEALAGRGAVALAGDDRGLAEYPEVLLSRESLVVIAAVFGGMAVMVAMFVVASTLSLSVQQRQRELALLRAIGTTSGQVRRMVIGEAMVVSTLATVLGCLPGLVLGQWLFDQLAANGIAPKVVEFHQGLVPLAAGAGAALITALIAAYVTGRRAAKTRPTEALAEAAIPRRWFSWVRLLIALICIAGGVMLAVVTASIIPAPLAASTAGPAVIVWAIGLALLSPAITKVMAVLLQWPVRALTGLPGYLAMLNVRARTVAMAAAVTPIMLATGIATANLYMQTTQVAAGERAFAESLRADAVLTSTTGGLPVDLPTTVGSVPGVAGASALVTSTAFVEGPYDDYQSDDGYPVQGVTAEGVSQTMAFTTTAGSLTDLHGNTVALAEKHAQILGRGVGDTITLRLGDRAKIDVRVVALLTSKPGYETMLMPADVLAPHTTAGLPTQILVRAAPGVDQAKLAADLGGAVQRLPGVVVSDRSVLTAAQNEGQQTQAWVNYLLVGMVIGYTAISVVNTLVMATVKRRREFGLQRLTGSTKGQIMRMMSIEAALVAVMGIILGTVAALISLIPFSIAVADSATPSGPLWIYLLVVVTAAGLTLLATLLPTRLAMRLRPAEAAVATD